MLATQLSSLAVSLVCNCEIQIILITLPFLPIPHTSWDVGANVTVAPRATGEW